MSINSAGRVDITAARGVGGRFTVTLDGQRVLDIALSSLTADAPLSTVRNVTLPRALSGVTIGYGWAAQ